jgi:hypothetical protein
MFKIQSTIKAAGKSTMRRAKWRNKERLSKEEKKKLLEEPRLWRNNNRDYSQSDKTVIEFKKKGKLPPRRGGNKLKQIRDKSIRG